MWCLSGGLHAEQARRNTGTSKQRERGNTVALSEDVREIQVIDETERPDAPVVVGRRGRRRPRHPDARAQARRQPRARRPQQDRPRGRPLRRTASTTSTRCASPPAPSAACSTAPPPTELDNLSIRTAAAFIAEEPNYSRLAARLLATVIDKEVQNQDIYSFSQSVALGQAQGIIGDETAEMVATHARKLNDAILAERNWRYEFFGLRTVYDRYLLRHPESRKVIETPQYFLMRVACGLATSPDEAIEFYELISSLDYLPCSPTLFNSGTTPPADVELLPARLARGQPRRHLRPLPRRRPALEVRRRHRPRPTAASARAAR